MSSLLSCGVEHKKLNSPWPCLLPSLVELRNSVLHKAVCVQLHCRGQNIIALSHRLHRKHMRMYIRYLYEFSHSSVELARLFMRNWKGLHYEQKRRHAPLKWPSLDLLAGRRVKLGDRATFLGDTIIDRQSLQRLRERAKK